jgi:hypothetical protein
MACDGDDCLDAIIVTTGTQPAPEAGLPTDDGPEGPDGFCCGVIVAPDSGVGVPDSGEEADSGTPTDASPDAVIVVGGPLDPPDLPA